jgi:hypothetical protein
MGYNKADRQVNIREIVALIFKIKKETSTITAKYAKERDEAAQNHRPAAENAVNDQQYDSLKQLTSVAQISASQKYDLWSKNNILINLELTILETHIRNNYNQSTKENEHSKFSLSKNYSCHTRNLSDLMFGLQQQIGKMNGITYTVASNRPSDSYDKPKDSIIGLIFGSILIAVSVGLFGMFIAGIVLTFMSVNPLLPILFLAIPLGAALLAFLAAGCLSIIQQGECDRMYIETRHFISTNGEKCFEDEELEELFETGTIKARQDSSSVMS